MRIRSICGAVALVCIFGHLHLQADADSDPFSLLYRDLLQATNLAPVADEVAAWIEAAGRNRDLFMWDASILKVAAEGEAATDEEAANFARQIAFLAWCRDNAIRDAYVNVDPWIRYDRRLIPIRQFVLRAWHGYGVRIVPLLGKARWAQAENHHDGILDNYNDPVDFVERLGRIWPDMDPITAVTTGRPLMVMFDIEPHMLDEWNTDRATLAGEYLDLLVELQRRLHACSEPAIGRIQLGVTTHWNWSEIDTGWLNRNRPLSQWVIDAADRVLVMAYKDFAHDKHEEARGMVTLASEEVAYASVRGRSVVVGALANPPREGRPDYTTFWEEGRRCLDAEQALVVRDLGLLPGFDGVAVHDYGSAVDPTFGSKAAACGQ